MRVGPDANAAQAGSRHRPDSWGVVITVESAVARTIRVRIPAWIAGAATVQVAGELRDAGAGFVDIEVAAGTTVVELTLPTRVTVEPIPDEPSTVAFLDGPWALAGLVDHEMALTGAEPGRAAELLVPDNERQWGEWLRGYRTHGQARAIRFLPVHEVVDERYSLYFPIAAAGSAGR